MIKPEHVIHVVNNIRGELQMFGAGLSGHVRNRLSDMLKDLEEAAAAELKDKQIQEHVARMTRLQEGLTLVHDKIQDHLDANFITKGLAQTAKLQLPEATLELVRELVSDLNEELEKSEDMRELEY